MAVLKPEYLEETAREIHLLLDLWQKVREALEKALATEPITKEDEQDFLRVKSDGTKYHRILKKKLTDQTTRIKRLDFAYDKMLEILRSSISIAHLRALPESDVKRMRTDWHRIYIQLCDIVGAYDFLRSDQVNLAKVAKRTGMGAGPLAKVRALVSNKQSLAILVALIVIVGGVITYFFL
jgi:hypothetical protein